MPERNAQFLQIGFGHLRQDIKIDGVVRKDSRVLREPELSKPSRHLVVGIHLRALLVQTRRFIPGPDIQGLQGKPCPTILACSTNIGAPLARCDPSYTVSADGRVKGD